MNMPRRLYLNWTTPYMTLGIYKAQKSWGYNKGGNFVFDSHNDYYAWLGMKTYSKNFNFEYSLMFPEIYKGGTNYYTKLEKSENAQDFLPPIWLSLGFLKERKSCSVKTLCTGSMITLT